MLKYIYNTFVYLFSICVNIYLYILGLLEEIDLCHHKKRDDSLKRNINEHLKAAKRVKPSENHDSIVKHFLPENPKALKSMSNIFLNVK